MLSNVIVSAVEEGPDPNDVVAGWGGFAIFVGLILAVAVIGFFLVRSLRNVDRAEEAGMYGRDERTEPAEPAEPAETAAQDDGTPDR